MSNTKAAKAVSGKKSVSSAHNLQAHAALARRCRHVKMSGESCGAPARAGSDWCIFHAADYEGHFPTLGVYEDAASIQLELSYTIRQLQIGKLQSPEAGRILYALQIASQNLPRLREEMPSKEKRDAENPFPEKSQDLWWYLYYRLRPPEDRKSATEKICMELARFVRGEPLDDPSLLSKWLPQESATTTPADG